MTDTQTVLAGVGMVVAGVVWLVRIEGRVNLNEARWEDIKGDIAEIKADVKVIRRNGS